MKPQNHPTKWRPSITLLPVVVSVLLLTGCTGKEDTTPGTPVVYMAGYTLNSTSSYIPCYWKDQTRIDLLLPVTADNGFAEAIYVTQNTVYTAGNIRNNGIRVPCYWKNEERTNLSVVNPTLDGYVTDIQVVGNLVFTVGYTKNNAFKDVPCYWVNEERIDLPVLDATKDAQVANMQVVDNIIYMAGYTQNDLFINVPCYWINDTLVLLPVLDPSRDGEATGIQINGNDIYVSGVTEDNSGSSIPCYWKNGTRVDLAIPSGVGIEGRCTSVHVAGKDVYTAGYITYPDLLPYNQFQCYWVNGTRIDSSPYIFDVTSSVALSVQTVGKDIYTAGYIHESGSYTPCYWVNYNTRVDLPVLDPTKSGFGQAMQIVVE